MSVYFISDVHLGNPYLASNPEPQRLLEAFFRTLAGPENELFIVGDFFDFWFEWKQVIPARHFSVLHQLRLLTDSGTRVHLLPGNHDFAFGSFLTRETGIQIHPEHYEFTRGGKRFHLWHGDGLHPRERSYRLLKRIIRHPLSISLFRLLHPDWGMKLADRVTGRYQHQSPEPTELLQAAEAYTRDLTAVGIDFVILGHLHHQYLRPLEEGTLLIIGDWINSFNYGEFHERSGQLTAHSFSL
jgi:UDP-2,3-diacylglucosamine hydrolase